MRAPLVLAALGLALAGCNNIASPAITNIYEFRDVEFGDTLTFHWPRSMLPVRVWVAADSPIRENVETAIARWQNAMLYGEFRATLVADSTTADIIVRNAPSDIGGGILSMAPQCDGESDLDVDTNANTLTLPIHIFMFAVVADEIPGIPACYSITMTHELGHAIGLLVHSPDVGDVMYSNPMFDGISERDRQTVSLLYHYPATLTITGRR
jgi:predicted Zn-dependent protease